MSPFCALYGYDAMSFADIVFGDNWAPKAKDWILGSQDILKALKDNLLTTQNQQKLYADRHQRVIRRVGEVAYELELPPGSKIHNIFHVPCLKKVLGQKVTTVVELPPLDDEGHLVLESEAILETRERKLRSGTIREYLVHWKSLPDEDATWEGEHILEHPTLKLLGDKQHVQGEDYNVPS
eukprot:PITA_12541